MGEEAAKQMAEAPGKIESMRKWVIDHKLRAVGKISREFFLGFRSPPRGSATFLLFFFLFFSDVRFATCVTTKSPIHASSRQKFIGFLYMILSLNLAKKNYVVYSIQDSPFPQILRLIFPSCFWIFSNYFTLLMLCVCE